VDGVLYTVQGPPVQGSYEVVALDAVTGSVFWTFTYQPAPEARPCCGRVTRGLSILGDTLFLGTIDAHVLALDAKTGQPIWNIEAAKAADKYAITHAPLVVKDKVIVGMATSVCAASSARSRENRKGSLALLHDSRPGRAWQ
jgi:alcohol dehydrogenase (cytochrome c)